MPNTVLDMQPSDIVLFSSKLVHQSGANSSDNSRMLWLVTFVADIIDADRVANFLTEKIKRQPTMDCGIDRHAPRDAFGKLKK
mgnify:CR=1 FL=1